VTFRIGSSFKTGVTNASGVATASLPLFVDPGARQIVATFSPEDTIAGSSDENPITITGLGTSLTLSLGTGSVAGTPSGVSATLKSGSMPIAGRTITFVANGTGIAVGQGFVRSATTDAAGVASLGATPTVPVGTYTLTAYFGGTMNLHPWSAPSAIITIPPDPIYGSSSTSGPMKVIYPFTGFFSPVDNNGVVNVAKAGSTIPVKFSLGGNYGLAILNGDPKAIKLTSCGSGALDDIEVVTTSNSGLTYDAGSGQYQYNWKTDKSKTGCFRLEVALIDGQTYTAMFQLK
jgi:hypothetical protein